MHSLPHGQKCQSQGPRPIPVDFGCSRLTFERIVGFKKFGWAVFEKMIFQIIGYVSRHVLMVH